MYLVKMGLIGLDGAVVQLKASHDMHSYATALSQHYALLKLRSQAHARAVGAKDTPNETKCAAARGRL
jgi:hypothetical protein